MDIEHIVDGEQQVHDGGPEYERPLPAERGRAEEPVAAVPALDKPPAGHQPLAVGTAVNLSALLWHLAVTNVLLQRGLDIEVSPAAGALDMHGLKIIPHHLFPA